VSGKILAILTKATEIEKYKSKGSPLLLLKRLKIKV